MSDRLDLAEQALWVALGDRLDGLVPSVVRNAARQVLEAADSDSPEQQCAVLAKGGDRCVLRVGHAGFHERDDGAQGFVAGENVPRVTREMVVGGSGVLECFSTMGASFSCLLCGSLLWGTSTGVEPEPAIERHRAWHDRHDRLERLLVGSS